MRSQNTQVEVRFYHKNQEPPLMTYDLPDDPNEFYFNEVGWQDPITVTVNYQFPLLPGPGRLLAKYSPGPAATDTVAATIQQAGRLLHLSRCRPRPRIGNEGEKSVVTYVYQ